MNDPRRSTPITFDEWGDSLEPKTAEERVALSGAAAQLLRSPVFLRVLAILERDALANQIMKDPGAFEDALVQSLECRAVFRVRAVLQKLAEDAAFDRIQEDAETRRHN